jgi:putative membrane protein
MRGQKTKDLRMDQGSREMLKSADTAFALEAAQNGVAEVATAKLAAQKASSAEVKAFGQQAVNEYTKANNDLKSVAEKKRMTLPTDMNAQEHATYLRLRKLSGPAFDHAYIKAVMKRKQEDVKEFKKEAHTGKDEEIKGFALRTLPVLETHLQKIRSIQANMHQSGLSTK